MLVTSGTRWSRLELEDEAAGAAAREAEALGLRRQVERVQAWLANAESEPTWDDAAFATQNWLRCTPEELQEVAEEVVGVLVRWGQRQIPDDGQEREPVLVFARGFPCQP